METAAALSCTQMGYKRDHVEKAVRTYVNVNGKFNRAEAENKHDSGVQKTQVSLFCDTALLSAKKMFQLIDKKIFTI